MEGSAAFLMRRVSMKYCAMALAISRVMEKVVVVVVVTMREGSRGSGPRLDWANLRLERWATASSLIGVRWVRGKKRNEELTLRTSYGAS
jgi:hypothetical protein